MELRAKKGFTLLEAVVTISVLLIVIGMTTVVITNMVTIQNATASQYEINEEIANAYKVTGEYISFVSIDDKDLSFTYDSSSSSSLTFSCDTYTFSLRYANKTLSYSCDAEYLGEKEYLKKHNSIEMKNIDTLSFTYHDDIGMLEMDINVSNQTSHHIFTLRTAS